MKTLDKCERIFLLKKYMSKYKLDFDDALKLVNAFHDKLKLQRDELRKRKVSDSDIEIKFRKEFEELCRKLE